MKQLKRLMGLKKDTTRKLSSRPTDLLENLPDSFDSRQQWPHCPTIGTIRDQGDCGSCWVFGTSEVMSDRICIASKGKLTLEVSAEDILSCLCNSRAMGCDGGFLGQPWHYYDVTGVVSGGPYGSQKSCRPYELKPCEHHSKGPLAPRNPNGQPTPKCVKHCIPSYNITYKEDKHYGYRTRYLPTEAAIMSDMFVHGPVTSGFHVYEDFLQYKSGVYRHTTGSFVGNHAIKILGWGMENGEKYWLVANSWNVYWGDKGYFKILRGVDECDIEKFAIAGLPKV